jgi:hypothetical protein
MDSFHFDVNDIVGEGLAEGGNGNRTFGQMTYPNE